MKLITIFLMAFAAWSQSVMMPGPGLSVVASGGAPPTGYLHCKVITLSGSMVSGGSDLTNYTVSLVLAADNDLRVAGSGGFAQNSNGYDIGFFNGCTTGATALKWEMESYTSTTGAMVAHVLMTTLHTAGDTIGMAFDGAQSSFQGGALGSQWSANHKGVWHLPTVTGGAASVLDSTSNAFNGSPSGSPTNVAAQVNGGGAFTNAGTQYVDLGSSINPTALTYSAWVYATAFNHNYNGVVARNSIPTSNQYTLLTVEGPGGAGGGTGKLACEVFASGDVGYFGSGIATLSTGTWYFLALTYDSTNGLTCYVNGVLDGSAAANGTLANGANTLRIGSDASAARNWDGRIDEVRILDRAQTVGEILTQFRNQSAPATYITVGSLI